MTENSPKKRDWFGYIFTTVIGIIATILVAWYQTYLTQKEGLAAEMERTKAVKQTIVSIIEDRVLNNKNIEVERLTRIIDQKRHDELISMPIALTDAVTQAEYNIENSRYLSLDKKDEIKKVFDVFYDEMKSRSYKPFPSNNPSSEILNEIAKDIQNGKSTEALSALQRLDESYSKERAERQKFVILNIFEGLNQIFSSPIKISLLIGGFILYMVLVTLMTHVIRRRRIYRIYQETRSAKRDIE